MTQEKLLYAAALKSESAVVLARQFVKRVAGMLDFNNQDQTRIATAVSELTRNAFQYAGSGKIELTIRYIQPKPAFMIYVRDEGPGITNLPAIVEGRYTSQTGMGLGLRGAKRLMDIFEIDSEPGKGTEVVIGKFLPASILPQLSDMAQQIHQMLRRETNTFIYQEVWDTNQELLLTLNELQKRQEDLNQVNAELAETNKGVLALYTELEEKAHQLQEASDTKSRFISNVTHEFRSPLNTIRGLGQMLLERLDGPLTDEQEKQVNYILKAAENMMEMVNDLLDLAKIEAGRIDIHPAPFELEQVFSALRGMMKPLHQHSLVEFQVEPPTDIPTLVNDEGKVSQVLRNLLSNAFKFTEQGGIRMWAQQVNQACVRIHVADTGVGIAPDDQKLIFEEFVQVANHLQKKTQGTGLGLPLSRRLAELMGGALTVSSEPGQGSVFTLTLPLVYGKPLDDTAPLTTITDTLQTILIIDDSEVSSYILQGLLGEEQHTIHTALSGQDGLAAARTHQPDVIFLDLMMPGMSGFDVLEVLKNDAALAPIPVIIYTSQMLSEAEQRYLKPRVAAILSKEADSPEPMRQRLHAALNQAAQSRNSR